MTSKSKLGAITFVATMGVASIAAIGVATPAFAANSYSPAANGGGSAGYNHSVASDYRLKPHHGNPQAKEHQPNKTQQKQ